MKKLKIAMGLGAAALLLTLSACKKDSNNNNTETCDSGLLCAHVDGVSYTAKAYNFTRGSIFTSSSYNGSYGQLVASSTSTGGYYMNISGNNSDGNSDATWEIDMRITQLPTVGGTYTSQAGSASFDYYAGTSSNQLHYVTDASHTGTVTITKIDTVANQVSGTFSFEANTPSGQSQTPATHSITSGSFTDLIIRR
ncbi:MAG: hypothetical protein JSS76_02835 [Bacteroidetes bacterium]|nr:hypothetical protein [Bacteroidota bacterium]